MEKLKLEATQTTLEVLLDKQNAIFLFKGRSRPENAFEYYQQIFDWLEKYQTDPLAETIVEFKLDYFNSTSAKMFIQILSQFEQMVNMGQRVIIKWYYKSADEDMREVGEDFEDILNLPFEFIVYD